MILIAKCLEEVKTNVYGFGTSLALYGINVIRIEISANKKALFAVSS
jgi:hypothetical protein